MKRSQAASESPASSGATHDSTMAPPGATGLCHIWRWVRGPSTSGKGPARRIFEEDWRPDDATLTLLPQGRDFGTLRRRGRVWWVRYRVDDRTGRVPGHHA